MPLLTETIQSLYQKLRLLGYRRLFASVREKSGSLSATEAFSADVIHLMGRPTISQFAALLGISQPNATYKVHQLTKKGYLRRERPADRDGREVVLVTSEKFSRYFDEKTETLERYVGELKARFSDEELAVAARVLHTLDEIIR